MVIYLAIYKNRRGQTQGSVFVGQMVEQTEHKCNVMTYSFWDGSNVNT